MKRLLSLLLLLSAMQCVAALPVAALPVAADVPAACGFAAASDFPAVPASASAFARRDASASGFQADPAPGFHALFGFHGSPVIYAASTSGSAAGFSSGSAASAAAAGATQGASPLPPAADRAAGILAGVRDGFRALGAYGVSFEVRSDEYVTRGRYAVEGEGYYLVLGDAEVYCDGAVRYEVDNRRREVTIDVVDTDSRNILNNPVHAFDFLGSEYAASLAGEQEGRAVVRLTPVPGNTSSAGNIVLTVDTAAMRPVSLRYDYDGEQVQVSVLGIKPLETPLKAFAKDNYAGYEFIDFR
jgi:hypothetical protein